MARWACDNLAGRLADFISLNSDDSAGQMSGVRTLVSLTGVALTAALLLGLMDPKKSFYLAIGVFALAAPVALCGVALTFGYVRSQTGRIAAGSIARAQRPIILLRCTRGGFSWVAVASACMLAAGCSTTPTTPSTVQSGPVISQRPLVALIPQDPPRVPPLLVGTSPTVLGASKFVALGDIATYGVLSRETAGMLFDYAVPSHSYPVRLELGLDFYYGPRDYQVVNAGLPLEGAIDGARRIQSVITQNRPQGLLLLEGINDLAGGASIGATVNALDSIINTARVNNVTVSWRQCRRRMRRRSLRTATTQRISSSRSTMRSRLVSRGVRTYTSSTCGNRSEQIIASWAPTVCTRTRRGTERMASAFLHAIEQVFRIRGSFQ